MDSVSNGGELRLPSLGFSSFSPAAASIGNDGTSASFDPLGSQTNRTHTQEEQEASLRRSQEDVAPRKLSHLRDEGQPHHCLECSRLPAAAPRFPSRQPPLFLVPKEDGTGVRRLRVLFIHGFESGPKGRRSVALGRHFECYTPWMREELEPILRWRRNRVVHACIALFLLLLGLAFLIAYTTHHMGGLMVSVPALLVSLVGVYFVVQSAVIRFVAHPAIRGCLEKQRAAIRSFKPDVVVGSSWGGGIATYLMMEGSWTGPTVLLAPAGGIISRKARFLSSSQLHIPSSVGFVHLVHSKLDRIVPVQDTIDLFHRSLLRPTAAADQDRLLGLNDQPHVPAPGSEHDQDAGAHEMDELGSAKRANQDKGERIKLTVVEDDDHPLSRTMREEHLREAVLEAYTFVHHRR